jgi:ribonuclease P protein component
LNKVVPLSKLDDASIKDQNIFSSGKTVSNNSESKMLNAVRLLPLKNTKAFEYISKDAIKYTCRYFIIYISKLPENYEILSKKSTSPNLNSILYGFKISRKYGKAVDRNLLRRRLKNIYLQYFKQNYYPLSIVFIPRKEITTLEFIEIKNEIFKAINWLVNKLNQNIVE